MAKCGANHSIQYIFDRESAKARLHAVCSLIFSIVGITFRKQKKMYTRGSEGMMAVHRKIQNSIVSGRLCILEMWMQRNNIYFRLHPWPHKRDRPGQRKKKASLQFSIHLGEKTNPSAFGSVFFSVRRCMNSMTQFYVRWFYLRAHFVRAFVRGKCAAVRA